MISELTFGDDDSISVPTGVEIFCDLDGTLIDTDYANHLSYRRAVLEVTRGSHDLEFGVKRITRESLRMRLPSLSNAELKIIVSLKTTYFSELLTVTRLNTALARIITEHSTKNTIVLVTYCRERRAEEVLRYHKLLDCFSRLICREALSNGESTNKYESALRMMGASRKSVIVFENDTADVDSAIVAGIPRSNIYRVVTERVYF